MSGEYNNVHLLLGPFFKIWTYSFFMPYYKFDTSEQIFVYEKNCLRIFLCLLLFSLCLLLFVFNVDESENFLGFFINNIEVTLNRTLTMFSILIIYRSTMDLRNIQKRMEKLDYDKMVFGKGRNVCLYWFLWYISIMCVMFRVESFIEPKTEFWEYVAFISMYICYFISLNVHIFYLSFMSVFNNYFLGLNKSLTDIDYELDLVGYMEMNSEIQSIFLDYWKSVNVLFLSKCTWEFSSMIVAQYWIIVDPIEKLYSNQVAATIFFRLWSLVPACKVLNLVVFTMNINNEVRYF